MQCFFMYFMRQSFKNIIVLNVLFLEKVKVFLTGNSRFLEGLIISFSALDSGHFCCIPVIPARHLGTTTADM